MINNDRLYMISGHQNFKRISTRLQALEVGSEAARVELAAPMEPIIVSSLRRQKNSGHANRVKEARAFRI